MPMNNGYIEVFAPTHHRAHSNGCVYEHILVAERCLGRVIHRNEAVHHIDGNKCNNSSENIIVFKSNADHIRYHVTGMKIKKSNGTWVSPLRLKTCPVCGKEYGVRHLRDEMTCGKVCAAKRRADSARCRRKVKNRPSKEELCVLITNTPFVRIGAMFGVTDNAVRRWCRSYGLPRTKRALRTVNVKVCAGASGDMRGHFTPLDRKFDSSCPAL